MGSNEAVIWQIKRWRVDLDTLAKGAENVSLMPMAKDLEEGVNKYSIVSHHVRQSHLKLLYAKAWLGEYLGTLGTENPYPAVDKVSDIPPTQDVAVGTCEVKEHETVLDNLNEMRARIQGLKDALWEFSTNSHIKDFENVESMEDVVENLSSTHKQTLCLASAIRYATEAKFDLGFALEALKKAEG